MFLIEYNLHSVAIPDWNVEFHHARKHASSLHVRSVISLTMKKMIEAKEKDYELAEIYLFNSESKEGTPPLRAQLYL